MIKASTSSKVVRTIIKKILPAVFLFFTNSIVFAHNWYVNDNQTTGDIFTLSVGNDSNPGTAALPFATIQAAITAAASGDTIYVDAGSYTADITISKSLTLLGAKFGIAAGPAAIPPNRGSNESVIIGSVLFGASTDNITVDGFSVNRGSGLKGIEARGLNSKVLNNIVSGTLSLTTIQTGISTRANAPARTHSYLISNNNVSGFRYGIYFDGGIETPSMISNNYVTGAYTAAFMVVASSGHTIKANVVESCAQGMIFTQGNNMIEQNTLKSIPGNGIRLSGTANLSNNTIINNYFQSNGVGINLTNPNAGAINNQAHDNFFSNNNSNIVNTHTALFDATCNWYETTSSSTISPTISGNVQFIPYLYSGTDADPLTDGFQSNQLCTGTCNLGATIQSTNPCQGISNGSLTVQVTGGINPSVVWTPGNLSTTNINGLSAGVYNVTVTDVNGCTFSTAATLTATFPDATISVSGNTSFCAGGSVTLTAPAGYTYLWNTQDTSRSIHVTSSGNYSVTITAANGCSALSAPKSITVFPLPIVTANNAIGCPGAPIQLTGSPVGGVFSVPNPYSGPNTSFTYFYTDSNGCSNTSAPATITFQNLPTVTASNVVVCAGNPVQLIGTPPGGSFSLPNPYTGPDTTYTYTYTNSNGCTNTSAPATIKNHPLPVVTANNVKGCTGFPIQLSGSPAGGQFSLPNPYTGPSTTYTYTYTDSFGCTKTSAPATITTNNLPVVTAANVSGCKNVPIYLVGSPAGGTFSLPNPYLGPSTTYTYTYTDANGCTKTSAPATITVNFCGCQNCGRRRVLICHYIHNGPFRRMENICVSGNSAQFFLEHGDTCGPCGRRNHDHDFDNDDNHRGINNGNVKVITSDKAVVMKINPNPVQQQAQLLFVSNLNTNVRITIVDIMGKTVSNIYQGPVKNNEEYLFNFDAANLPGGMYLYKVQTDNEIYTEKILIVKNK